MSSIQIIRSRITSWFQILSMAGASYTDHCMDVEDIFQQPTRRTHCMVVGSILQRPSFDWLFAMILNVSATNINMVVLWQAPAVWSMFVFLATNVLLVAKTHGRVNLAKTHGRVNLAFSCMILDYLATNGTCSLLFRHHQRPYYGHCLYLSVSSDHPCGCWNTWYIISY